MASREQLVSDLRVPLRSLKLKDGGLVACKAEPFKAVEDRGDSFLGRTGAIGIFDTQQELAAMVPGE